jgi:hypothetical protein
MLHDDAAHVLEQGRLPGSVHQRAVAGTQCGECAVHAPQLLPGLFGFLLPLFKIGGHGVERLRQLAKLGAVVRQPGAGAGLAAAQAVRGFGQRPRLAQHEDIAAPPGDGEHQQGDCGKNQDIADQHPPHRR